MQFLIRNLVKREAYKSYNGINIDISVRVFLKFISQSIFF